MRSRQSSSGSPSPRLERPFRRRRRFRASIEIAKKPKDGNAEWHVSSVENLPILHRDIGTICFRESTYYVKPADVPSLLARCRQSLASGGRIVIRIFHADRHREYIALLAALGAQSNPLMYILNQE